MVIVRCISSSRLITLLLFAPSIHIPVESQRCNAEKADEEGRADKYGSRDRDE